MERVDTRLGAGRFGGALLIMGSARRVGGFYVSARA